MSQQQQSADSNDGNGAVKFDIVIPKNPPKILQCFLRFIGAENHRQDLENTWPKFRELGKEPKPKGSKKSTKKDADCDKCEEEKEQKPKRQRRARMSYKKALEIIQKLQVDDTVKSELAQNVKQIYQATKEE